MPQKCHPSCELPGCSNSSRLSTLASLIDTLARLSSTNLHFDLDPDRCT